MSKHYVLAAGGTGGHMVPAAALATELTRRGHRVALVSDERGVRFPDLFDGIQTHVLPAGRLSGGPIGWAKAARQMLAGRSMAIELYKTFRPSAVIGFGGYPALPALLAAFAQKVPTIVHEQNAVLGRVNRLVAGSVHGIATSYERVDRLKDSHVPKTHLVGNPVREAVLALRERPYPALDEEGIFRVLVTGGSQGASILSQVVPDGLALLPVAFRRRMQVTHQARIEDIDAVRAKYAEHGIPAEIATYLPDLPDRLAWSHVVIARAGASTIAELWRRAARVRSSRHSSPRRNWRSRFRSSASIPPLSPMRRHGLGAVAGRSRSATSPIWSRASTHPRQRWARSPPSNDRRKHLREGRRNRHRHDPFRRHRWHRHVGHCRGDAQSRL